MHTFDVLFLCLFLQIGAERLEEETLAAAQRERLEDIAKSERQAEAALDLCRKDWHRNGSKFTCSLICTGRLKSFDA